MLNRDLREMQCMDIHSKGDKAYDARWSTVQNRAVEPMLFCLPAVSAVSITRCYA